MNNTIDSLIKKKALIMGGILGAILLAVDIGTFYFITTMNVSMALIVAMPILTSVIFRIGIGLLFAFTLRKQIGGYWPFKQAVTGIFIMFLTCTFILQIGRDVVFARFVEPQMVEKVKTISINATTVMLEKSKIDQTQIDQKIAEIEKGFDDQKNVTVGTIIQGVIMSIIMVFVVSLIFAAVVKKDPPVEIG